MELGGGGMNDGINSASTSSGDIYLTVPTDSGALCVRRIFFFSFELSESLVFSG